MSQANTETDFQTMLNDGFVMVPTLILIALSECRLSKRELKLVNFIILKTFGFHKMVDRISLSQFEEATGIAKHHTCQLLKKLVEDEVLVKKRARDGYLYGINPALIWRFSNSKLRQSNVKKSTEKVTKEGSTGVTETGTKRVTETGKHNIYNTKYNNIIIKEPCSENEQGLNVDQEKNQNPTPEDFQKVNAIVFESLEEQYGSEFIQNHKTLIKSKLMDNEAYCRQNGYFPKVSMALKYVQTGIDNYLKTQKRTAQITAALDKKARATTDYQFKITQALERKMDAIAQRGRTTAEELTDYSWANKFSFEDSRI
ncbi:replication protein [Zooshikella sp. RANM57]|uniref:replication protein n=1 Tax=Zooshikella sp. RANM57 TaxID=3425863 RepID=UPI003D6F1472